MHGGNASPEVSLTLRGRRLTIFQYVHNSAQHTAEGRRHFLRIGSRRAGVALATSAALGLLGLMVALFADYTRWIYSQPWLPLIGLEYGFLLGIVFDAIVCWKVIRSRLRGAPTQ